MSTRGSVTVVGFGLAAWSEISPILLKMSPVGLFHSGEHAAAEERSGGPAHGLVLQPDGFDAPGVASGSEKKGERSTTTVSPAGTVRDGSESAAAGSSFGTVTDKAC